MSVHYARRNVQRDRLLQSTEYRRRRIGAIIALYRLPAKAVRRYPGRWRSNLLQSRQARIVKFWFTSSFQFAILWIFILQAGNSNPSSLTCSFYVIYQQGTFRIVNDSRPSICTSPDLVPYVKLIKKAGSSILDCLSLTILWLYNNLQSADYKWKMQGY